MLCLQGNLFVVGDPDQAIYGWRGANSDYMQNMLDHDFPGVACGLPLWIPQARRLSLMQEWEQLQALPL